MVKFINNGRDRKIKIPNLPRPYCPEWRTVKKGDTIELPEMLGVDYGFDLIKDNIKPKAFESKIGNVKVETKKKDNNFSNELVKIKGIGKKTAKDIVKVFGSREELTLAISHGDELPFNDNIEKILIKRFKNG